MQFWAFLLCILAVLVIVWILTRSPTTTTTEAAPTPEEQMPVDEQVATLSTSQDEEQGIEDVEPIRADRTMTPFNTLLLSEAPQEVRNELLQGLKVARLQGLDLPDDFDCREKWPGLITIPMEQGSCGSCWAFAAATAIADRYRIAHPDDEELTTLINYTPYGSRNIEYRILNNFDPYELVNCDICGDTEEQFPDTTRYLSGVGIECGMGCEGGYIEHVYRFVQDHGVSTILCNEPDCDPVNEDCPCVRKPDCKVYKPEDVYAVVSPTDNASVRRRKVQEDVMLYGPVTVGFMVYQSFFTFFENNPKGIYTRRDGGIAGDQRLGGHAVDIIGWSSEPVFHWLIRNSWSHLWSDEGYFRMQHDFGGVLDQVMAAQF